MLIQSDAICTMLDTALSDRSSPPTSNTAAGASLDATMTAGVGDTGGLGGISNSGPSNSGVPQVQHGAQGPLQNLAESNAVEADGHTQHTR